MFVWCALLSASVAYGGDVGCGGCFGVRLGEPVVCTPSLVGSVSPKNLRQPFSVVDADAFGCVCVNVTHVKIDRPFFGLGEAVVLSDKNGLAYGLSMRGSFRRGMARTESLAKILGFKNEVSKRVGFEIGGYLFSVQGPQNGVTESAGGRTLWMDMDNVCAYVVATNEDMEVSLQCSVNSGNMRNSGIVFAGDSPVEFFAKIVKIPIRDAEVQRMQNVRNREERTRHLKLSEFYGVDFLLPFPCSTNLLERKEFSVETCCDGRTNKFIQAYWARIDKTLRPACFFDFAQIEYAYTTMVAERVSFYGHFQRGVSRKECIACLDDFDRELNVKYGLVLKDVIDYQNEVGPDGFNQLDSYVHNEGDVLRYHFDCKNCFFRREFQNENVFVRLAAGETTGGERCVVLTCIIGSDNFLR